MRVYRYICLFLIFVLLAGSTTPVSAQDYRFQVPEQAVVVTINTDGSISIDYTMKFLNDSGAHAIDIVDIGLPNYDYDLKTITADINGIPIIQDHRFRYCFSWNLTLLAEKRNPSRWIGNCSRQYPVS